MRLAVTLGSLLLATACGGGDAAIERTARQFYLAVQDRDGTAACALLAPATVHELEQSAQAPCEQAVLEEDIATGHDATSVQRFGNQAQVRFGSDTAFLAEFPRGWRVVAVSCTTRGERPYDCQVKGS